MAFRETITDFMNTKVAPIAQRLGDSKYLRTISQSMMSMLTPLIVGSFAVLLNAFPVAAVSDFIASIGLNTVFSAVYRCTTGAMSLYVVFLMAKNLTEKLKTDEDGTLAGVLALMTFLVLTPTDTLEDGTAVLSFTWLGSQGVFSAMLVGLVVGRIYTFFRQKGWTIKMPSSVPPMVTKVFDSLFPGITISILAILVCRLFNATSFGSLHQCIYSVIQMPLQGLGGTLPAMILTSLLMQLLWFFGIHGSNVIGPIVNPIWMAMDAENIAALAAGEAMPNMVGYAFFNIFTFSGTSLGLVMLMLASKSKRYRELGKVAAVPILFGIGEPVVFGVPLMLNFDLAVPLITNNAICLAIAGGLTYAGIVAPCVGVSTVFGMPLGFFAMVGGSVSIVVCHLVLQLVVGPLLWLPWFKRVERRELALEAGAAEADAAEA